MIDEIMEAIYKIRDHARLARAELATLAKTELSSDGLDADYELYMILQEIDVIFKLLDEPK
jgi:hypothetical protein